MKQLGVILGLALMLTACATTIPRSIREAAPGNITVAEARAAGVRLVGSRIRWGGAIVSIRNHAADTWIEIVERPLDSDGRPLQTDRTDGRFFAQVAGFLDPSIYAGGRDVTVS
ncbi:MAG: Slp family lipoprotein, partial [Acidiferrobacterales bacterium]